MHMMQESSGSLCESTNSMTILLQVCEASTDKDVYPVKSNVQGKEQPTFHQEASEKPLTVCLNSIFRNCAATEKTYAALNFLQEPYSASKMRPNPPRHQTIIDPLENA